MSKIETIDECGIKAGDKVRIHLERDRTVYVVTELSEAAGRCTLSSGSKGDCFADLKDLELVWHTWKGIGCDDVHCAKDEGVDDHPTHRNEGLWYRVGDSGYIFLILVKNGGYTRYHMSITEEAFLGLAAAISKEDIPPFTGSTSGW